MNSQGRRQKEEVPATALTRRFERFTNRNEDRHQLIAPGPTRSDKTPRELTTERCSTAEAAALSDGVTRHADTRSSPVVPSPAGGTCFHVRIRGPAPGLPPDPAFPAIQPSAIRDRIPQSAFYKHLGFRQVDDILSPQSALRLWTFRR
ncbi:MAG TPA: hypothetical protein VK993_01855 [Chthoniobacterales bacterium]|nr:hypothetical protein [Chthoniobacterales bacterium]